MRKGDNLDRKHISEMSVFWGGGAWAKDMVLPCHDSDYV